MKRAFPFFIFFTAAFLIWQFSFSKTGAAQGGENSVAGVANYDIRTDDSEQARKILADFRAQSGDNAENKIELAKQRMSAAGENLKRRIPDLKIENGERLEVPEIIGKDAAKSEIKYQWLTAPNLSGEIKRADVLRSFIKKNSELFGLHTTQIDALKTAADYANPNGALAFAHLVQEINGLPVFQGEIKAGFTKNGEIARVINNLAPALDYRTLPTVSELTAQRAVVEAARSIGVQAGENETRKIATNGSNDQKTSFAPGQFARETSAEKIYFPTEPAVARLAWQILLWRETDAYIVVIDARDGTLLWRKNITNYQTQAATYNVYGNATSLMKTADSPTPSTPGCPTPLNCTPPPIVNRTNFTLIGNEPPYVFNNLGWINDNENRTIGNNAEAGIDRDGVNGIDNNGWAFGNPSRNFVYGYNPAPGNPAPGEEPLPTTQAYPPSSFQQGSVTNAFYVANRFHDELYRLGFTEQARNFQNDNFGRGGQGGDSISVEVQDSSGTNSANFSTAPDGTRPRLQLYVWTTPDPDRDGALDNQMIVHELTHGVSSRLHGNGSGLNSAMAGGMGEGWSDFFALGLLSEPTDARLAAYPLNGYAIFGVSPTVPEYYYGLHRFPTAVKAYTGSNGFPHNPLTLAHLNPGNCANFQSAFPPRPGSDTNNCGSINYIGEIWSAALWEARGQLVQTYGAAEGNRRSLQYVLDGMKLAPLNPTLFQERDAILTAAQIGGGAGDALYVRRGFALRGLGFSASLDSTNPLRFNEAFDLPPQLRQPARADFDGDGRSDISVFRPAEGYWYINASSAGFSASQWGLQSDVLTPGDYDGDGRTDLAVFRPSNDGATPDFYILNSSNFTFSFVSWGVPADIPVVADYDNDGKADPAVFRRDVGTFYVLKSTGGIQALSPSNGTPMPNSSPVAGDFDGDGKADFTFTAVPSANSPRPWSIRKSTNNYNPETFFFGIGTDKVTTADYDGDGRSDIAVYRPSDGTWYLRRSSLGDSYVQFGNSTDVPAPGDYDGDGKADIAVYRQGTWYLLQSTAGFAGLQFGTGSDIPIPNRYLP